MSRAGKKRFPLRVLLVSLPFRYFPHAVVRSKNYARPPLGIAYLAAYLRARATIPVEVRCLDMLAEPETSLEAHRDRILALRPDVVALSVLTANQPVAIEFAAALKSADPGIFIVAGGPHVTALPDEQLPNVDCRVIGEGEQAFLRVIEECAATGERPPIPGVIHQLEDGNTVSGGPAPLITDLDSLPFPARDLLPADAYFHSFPYPKVTGFTTMFTARGCPFNCNFCANTRLWGGRVRYHSVERVCAEIDHVTRADDVNLIFFDDDTFTACPSRATELMTTIRRRHPKLRWVCHTRVDTVDEELIREMAASGCVEVQVGVESGDSTVLTSTEKGIQLDQARRAISLFRRHDINVWATFVLGHELDTPESIERTITEAVKLDPTYASFIVLLPFPGTSVYDTFMERGYIHTTDWRDFSWHGYPVFSTDHLSADDLVAARARANMTFYLRPKKLAQLAYLTFRSASLQEMSRNFFAWLSLVAQASPLNRSAGRRGPA